MAAAKGDAYLLAGGTDLLVRIRGEFIDPDLVVDIKRIPAVQNIRKTASGFSIGAVVPCTPVHTPPKCWGFSNSVNPVTQSAGSAFPGDM